MMMWIVSLYYEDGSDVFMMALAMLMMMTKTKLLPAVMMQKTAKRTKTMKDLKI